MTVSLRSSPRLGWFALCLSGWLLGACAANAQDGAARCLEVKGALLTRSGKDWQAIKAGDAVAPGASLVSMFEARLESANKAVGIKLIADIGEFGPLPVLETAIRLQKKITKADLAVTLERGIVAFANLKDQGSARVLVTLQGETLDITLTTPGTKLGVELYGRHPGGAPHLLKDEPTMFVFVLISEGAAVVRTTNHTYDITAPPGRAFLRWDSVSKHTEVIEMEKFPAEFKRNEQEKQQLAKLCAAAEKLAGNEPSAAAARMLKDGEALERRVAVTALGAVNDLPGLLDALADAKHKDVREQAVLATRAWMGRAPGQLKGLRVAMLKEKYTLAQMKVAMHLLFGFDDQERVQPAVFELLISALESKNVAVRELAHWHLVRLAPKGRDIPYDAGAADADRQAAVERWRQFIPAGELPPRPKTEKQ